MHSRKHGASRRFERRDGQENEDYYDDDEHGRKTSYSKALCILLFVGLVLCFGLTARAFHEKQVRQSSSLHNTPVISYEDFPDINVREVQEKAMALMHPQEIESQSVGERREGEVDNVNSQRGRGEAEMTQENSHGTKDSHAVNVNLNEGQMLSKDSLAEEYLFEAKAQIADLREMKFVNHVVMESDSVAQERIKTAQKAIRKFLTMKYGPGPYFVKMRLQFPSSMMDSSHSGGLRQEVVTSNKEESIVIELAPIDYVPYSVYMFLENIVKGFKTGAFHRNAGHVLQAMVTVFDESNHKHHESFAWQEYSPHYPHKKYTLGYAGRPSSNGAFYISTVDNVKNHGPGSQGSKSEADSIIGRIFEGEDVVRRMCKQPNKGPNGFIKSPADYIKILSLELMESYS